MTNDQDASAKFALLQAAQALFAEEGFEKVSMRTLTQKAGVNLAAVNYHFGSKQGLIEAVIAGYINPVNQARLKALESAEGAAEGRPVALETILDCFLGPVLEAVRKSEIAEKLFFQLLGRCMVDQSLSSLPDSVMETFQQVLIRFPQALHRSLPELSEEEILWRLHFSIGVLVHVLSRTEGFLHLAGGRVGKPAFEEILAMVRTFCRAGLMSPAVKETVEAS